jgi:hypothetical protein
VLRQEQEQEPTSPSEPCPTPRRGEVQLIIDYKSVFCSLQSHKLLPRPVSWSIAMFMSLSSIQLVGADPAST